MQKRGQVSVFIIIGILIIAAIVFAFVLFRSFQEKAREITNPQEYLNQQLQDIKKVVVKCIDDSSSDALKKLSLQGGYFDPVKYTDYYGNKIAFLCYKIKADENCYNMMFTRREIEDQLMPVLKDGIKKCVDLGLVSFQSKDYSLSTGDYGFDFVFSDEALLVNLNYPVTLTKGNITQVQDKFTREVRSDFWKKVSLASSIVNMEARGEIVNIAEMSPKNLFFMIGRTETLGGSIYMIVPRNNNKEIFYFAVCS